MKISDYRADYYHFTGKASDIVRQLALAGIAVVWLLKGTAPSAVGTANASDIHLSAGLLIPSIGFLVSLALDLAQYAVAAVIWKRYYRELENRELPGDVNRDEHDFGFHDVALERPITYFFWAKIGAAGLAWCVLVAGLVIRLAS